jgi:hypothetical protein
MERLTPSSTYATSPGLQSSLAPNVPASPTAHSLAASSSRSICAPSIVFCRTRTGHQGRGPWFPRHVEPSGMSSACNVDLRHHINLLLGACQELWCCPRYRARSQAWTQPLDKEDIAVGSHGLISGRDNMVAETAFQMILTNGCSSPCAATVSRHQTPRVLTPTFSTFLPKDRDLAQHIVNIYFERLNFHRPVFLRHEFEVTLAQLYAGESQQHDPGFYMLRLSRICPRDAFRAQPPRVWT